jgi:short-subunit dehydrogenase
VEIELEGKAALITGASRGIGRAVSIELAKSRCSLLLTALEEDELAGIADEIQVEYGMRVESMAANLTDDADRQRLVDWVGNREQSPDVVVMNAGGGRFDRFSISSKSDVARTLDLNIRATTLMIRDLLPVLKTRPHAKIVIISSAIARLPYPGMAVYGAAKGYLSSFSESLACELHGSQVSVLCFHPGFTETHFMSSAEMDMSKVPRFLILTPEVVAGRVVKAIRKDKLWAFSDIGGRLGLFLAACMPRKLRVRLFKNLFWRLP